MKLAITYWARLRDPVGRRVNTTWAALVARLSVARVAEVKLEVPGLALATFTGDRRALANVEQVFAVGLDLDKGVPPWAELCERFSSTTSFLHTTWQSTAEAPRARVFLLLSRPVTGDEYRRVYSWCSGVVEAGGLTVDRAASDPSRFWFLPATRPGGAYASCEGKGSLINVEAVLEATPPPPPPSVPPPPSGTHRTAGDVEARAAAYLEKCGPAIAGSGGHNATFSLAVKLVRGFSLDEESAYRLLATWNLRCVPPWDERALRRKIKEAASRGSMPDGALRDADRGRR